jgi:outer membrane receptor protein involved in Fe transport
MTINRDRLKETANSLTLPGYVQTDAAIFYALDNFKAAISVQNLFNAEDEQVIKRSLIGTVWVEF